MGENRIMRSRITLVATAAVLTLGSSLSAGPAWADAAPEAPATAAAAAPKTPGLGDPGQLVEVQVDSGRAVDGAFTLDGQPARIAFASNNWWILEIGQHRDRNKIELIRR